MYNCAAAHLLPALWVWLLSRTGHFASLRVHHFRVAFWLDKLKLACKHDHQKLMPGTYMAAFYTRSTRDGFQILMPHSEHPSMLPHVKISDGYFSASDWAAVCEIEAATVSGKEAANIPKNWAAAKSWMGPEAGAEKQFSMVQKFFYGIVSLRQRLERYSAEAVDLRACVA